MTSLSSLVSPRSRSIPHHRRAKTLKEQSNSKMRQTLELRIGAKPKQKDNPNVLFTPRGGSLSSSRSAIIISMPEDADIEESVQKFKTSPEEV